MLRFSTPPLSGKSLTGSGFWARQWPVFHHGEDAKILAKREEIKPIFGDEKHAFTLAEVLITLVIIGVIAALTIPNLMQKYTEQETVKKVQKFYSTLSTAYSLAIKENGTINEWGLTNDKQESSPKIYNMLIKPYFKIAKDCGFNNNGNCFPDSWTKTLNNNEGGNISRNSNYYKITLDDGSALTWYAQVAEPWTYIAIIYKTNGHRGPNMWGRDVFSLVIRHDIQRPIPYGFPPGNGRFSAYNFNTNCKKDSTDNSPGIGCTAWVIYKGNMDYLHCNLTWDQNSCKDK